MEKLSYIVCSAFTALFCHILWSWYSVRSRVNSLRKQGFPMHEWSWIFGHLLVLRRYMRKFPPDVFINVVTKDMLHDFPESDMFYLDLWPFATPLLCIGEPAAAQQLTSKHNLPKPALYRYLLDPVMGGPNLITMNGNAWKNARGIFNPGFNHKYLLYQTSKIMDSIEVFCQILRERADSKTVFPLEEILTRLTMEIIAKVVLDNNLNYQKASNPLADSLRSLIEWSSFGNPFTFYHPIRPFAIKYYSGIMDRYIEKAFKKRFEQVEHHPAEHISEGSKSAVSLALKEYSRTKESEDFSTARFLRFAIPQIRVFLFAGHDTTTSIMVYTYHVLSKRADILNRLREEHAAVLGDDMELKCLREKPSLLDQLPYTTAVIKETMRMYPPAGTMREGLPNAFLTDRNGRRYPTEGCQATVFHIALHHNPRVWTRSMEYLPERWLVGPGDPLYPPDSGFRGFELGPRNCIGQDLAQLEIRLVLVMTVRQFNITPAYEKWDGMRGRGWLSGLAALLGIGGKETRHSVNGERAYPVEKGGAHPAHGYPCEVARIE